MEESFVPRPASRVAACRARGAALLLLLSSLFLSGCGLLLPPRLGWWVLNEGSNRTLDSQARIDEMLSRAESSGVHDLFVQVYRGNRSWYPSKLADDEPSRRAAIPGYRSPLAYILEQAHRRNLRVHAWVNVFRIAANRQAPILRRLGREAVLVDNYGRSMLDYEEFRIPGELGRYFVLGTPGYWLDPGSERVQQELLAIVAELIDLHPQLDGVHFDFLRYPYVVPINPGVRFAAGVDFGYGVESRERFERQSQRRFTRQEGRFIAPKGWDEWRRGQVNAFVRRAHRLVKQANPDMALSAAVLAWADRAYLTAFQDWRGWLDEGLLDFAVVMAYSTDTQLVRHLSRQALAVGGRSRAAIGLGAYMLLDDLGQLRRQLDVVEELRPGLIVLFSYDSMLQRPESFEALRAAP
ncbi:MAG: family 10 glycosylhydrolase [Candidatus Tectomicrobia bacterium]|nr:family 10 glycosylhydrolase [Candidatus Tectomicrobia bacterium]